MIQSENLFSSPFDGANGEHFMDILSVPGVRIERVVSTGQATPEGEWLAQDWLEWVVLLSGAAALRVEGEPEARVLKPGDWTALPAQTRHRVEWSDARTPTVWLAVHVGEPAKDAPAGAR